MYKVTIIKKAQKDLDKIEDNFFSKLVKLIGDLSKNPRPNGCIKLTNKEEYRIRMGNFRVLYEIDDKTKKVYITRIKHRKEVYR